MHLTLLNIISVSRVIFQHFRVISILLLFSIILKLAIFAYVILHFWYDLSEAQRCDSVEKTLDLGTSGDKNSNTASTQAGCDFGANNLAFSSFCFLVYRIGTTAHETCPVGYNQKLRKSE